MTIIREAQSAPTATYLKTEHERVIQLLKTKNVQGELELRRLPYNPKSVDDPASLNEIIEPTRRKRNEETGFIWTMAQYAGAALTYFPKLAFNAVSGFFEQQKEALETKHRVYLVYEPKNYVKRKQEGSTSTPKKMAVILLLHGTCMTCYGTRQLIQKDGEVSWLKLADEEDVLLVFGQARGTRDTYVSEAKGTTTTEDVYVWMPGAQDMHYYQDILRELQHTYKDAIDAERVYMTGFSNGGLATCDVLVNYINQVDVKIEEKPEDLKFVALCNYCGGLPASFHKREYEARKQKQASPFTIKQKVPYMIITGGKDENRDPCIRCNEFMTSKGVDVVYDYDETAAHVCLSTKTRAIYSFFMKHTRQSVYNTSTSSHTVSP